MAKTISPLAEHVLAEHQHQGRSNDCGPFSAAMVINAFSLHRINPVELARNMDQLRWNGILPVIRRIPNWATFPWGLVDVLRMAGFKAKWRPFGSTDGLIRILEEGRIPLIIVGGWRPLWGHVMVLLAHDPDQGWGFANPATFEKEIFWVPDPIFQRQWRAFGKLYISVNTVNPESG